MDIFTLTKDAQDTITGMLNSIQNNVEFEIRLGKYIFNKETKKALFESNVEIQFFYRLRNILKQKGLNCQVFNTKETIYNSNNSKGVIKQIYDFNENKTYYLYKNTFKKYDIREYDFRVSLASEKQMQYISNSEFSKPIFIRNKNRCSFFIDIGKIDMTIVQEFDSNNKFLQTKYEVEIEVSNHNTTYEKLMNIVSIIMQTRQENFYVIPSSERRYVFNEYKNLVGANYFIGAQAETLQKENINMLYKELYSVTDKADGERYFLFIDSNGNIYMLDSNICSILKTNIVCKEFASTIIDGELIKHPTYISFHAFDILFYKGKDLREDSNFLLPTRLEHLEKVMMSIPKNPIYIFQMKRFIFRNVFIGSEIIMSTINEKQYQNDGLIFTPMNETYPKKKKWSKLLKWKPSEKNSIDFFAVKTASDNGVGTWNLYVQHISTDESKSNDTHITTELALFDVEKLCGTSCGVETFTTSFGEDLIDPATGECFESHTVIEFVWDKDSRKFVPMRTRWDKTINPKKHGNFSSVAINIWNTIHNPVSLEFLSKFSNTNGNNFFFDQMRRYHNKVKEHLYKTYCKNTKSILELCSGKGGDLHKWMANNIQSVTGYDINQKSIDECYRRLSEVDQNKKFVDNYQFHYLDLNTEQAPIVVHKNAKGLYDSVICQFGFHYFCSSEESVHKMMTMIQDNIQENGYFILTFMDNSRLNQLFNSSEVVYSLNEQNDVIYYMKKEQQETLFGNKLKVYLNGNNVLSEISNEYIINYNSFTDIVKQYDFELVESKLFDEMNSIQHHMENYERDISFLNRFCVFQKKSNNTSVVSLKNERVESTSINFIEKTYRLIDIENQNIQLHKIETLYDIIDVLNCVKYTYNKLQYVNKNIESFDDVKQLFENIQCKYNYYFLNNPVSQHSENSIVFYYNQYTVEKLNKNVLELEENENSNLTYYNNWYIVLFNNKLVVHSEVCKDIQLEEQITNGNTNATETIEVKQEKQITNGNTNAETIEIKEIPQEATTTDENYEKWTVKQLQEKLKQMKLKVSGKKTDLINRLKNN